MVGGVLTKEMFAEEGWMWKKAVNLFKKIQPKGSSGLSLG